eukprot:TRINITY_DN9279_c0_g1_i1.p3 TRINITY_DN9279_c0_g1~~TRINITY_DN9279_c0_g1_i1.p3  ORF type:complete len:225 (-),score=102.96 TRINITY_DN9279_c0_g1_i1:81-755(-)
MSKRLGNWVSLDDVPPRAFRWLVVVAAYRSPLAFSAATVKAAGRTVRRLDAVRAKCAEAAAAGAVGGADGAVDPAIAAAIASARGRFITAMDDDLNTPRAAAALFGLVAAAEKAVKGGGLSPPSAAAVDACLADFDAVFGIAYTPPVEGGGAAAAGGGGGGRRRRGRCRCGFERRVAGAPGRAGGGAGGQGLGGAPTPSGEVGAGGWVVKDTPAGGVLVPLERA